MLVPSLPGSQEHQSVYGARTFHCPHVTLRRSLCSARAGQRRLELLVVLGFLLRRSKVKKQTVQQPGPQQARQPLHRADCGGKAMRGRRHAALAVSRNKLVVSGCLAAGETRRPTTVNGSGRVVTGLADVLSPETVCVQADGAPVLQSSCDSAKAMRTTSQPQERVRPGELDQCRLQNLVSCCRR